MLVPMTRIGVVGHRSVLDATVAVLQRLEVVHLTDADTSGLAVTPLPAEEALATEAERLRTLRSRLDALAELAPATEAHSVPSAPEPVAEVDLEALGTELDELTPRLEAAIGRLDAARAEQAVLPRHIESLRRLLPVIGDAPELDRYETVALLIERRHQAVLELLRSELAALIADRFEVVAAPLDATTVGAALIFPRSASVQVHTLLGREQVSEVRLPSSFGSLGYRQALSAMERRLEELPGEIEAARRAVDELAGTRAGWVAARAAIEARLGQLDVRRRLGSTRRTFVLTGWVPSAALPSLATTLRAEIGEAVAVEAMTADEPAPVLLANRPGARPFEPLVRLLALPRDGSIDPTPLMSLFMPLFFGMMLGDVVYGLVLGAVALAVSHRAAGRAPLLSSLGRVLALGAAWAVVWGVLYGEALGDLGHRLVGLEPLWIGREEALEPLLVLALGVGAAHVALGLTLGIWNARRMRSRHDLVQRAALLAALAGLFLLAQVAAGQLPAGLLSPAVAAVTVALVVLIGLDGPFGVLLGPLELFGVVGNVLSYLRIAAIGLASVQLARVANELGASGPLWLGIVVAVLFHALNLALGAFSPTIQALRLHYVEFFGRFYEEGGTPYQPFGKGG